MNQIQIVGQKDSTGCGIACVAMLALMNYDDVKAVFIKEQRRRVSNRRKLYTKIGALRKLSEKLGLKPELNKFTAWSQLACPSIVGVNQKTDKIFHWVVSLKTKDSFLIVDPEFGDVYQGSEWAKDENKDEGEYVGRENCQYIYFPDLKFSSIKI